MTDDVANDVDGRILALAVAVDEFDAEAAKENHREHGEGFECVACGGVGSVDLSELEPSPMCNLCAHAALEKFASRILKLTAQAGDVCDEAARAERERDRLSHELEDMRRELAEAKRALEMARRGW